MSATPAGLGEPTRPGSFGEVLQGYRLAAGWTQEELAQRARVSPHAISALERGARGRPRRETVRLLAVALGLAGPERDRFEGAARGPRAARLPGTDISEGSSPPAASPDVTLSPASPAPADHPPVSLPDRSLHTSSIPLEITRFIGREHEIAQIVESLATNRLLTLIGPGGTGKTRLALQAAVILRETFADGACFVSLAALTDANLVPSTVARALDVSEAAGRPLLESLKDYLRDRHLLLVLDNFEQVAEAAPMVTGLLAGSGRLRVLVTSRAPLRLYGEHCLFVPPMALPDRRVVPSLGNVLQSEAVQLFVERARAVKSSFAVTQENAAAVAEICHRLDGLPLAIELAAARLRALPLQAILDRIAHALPLLTGGPRDVPARQQTLRNTIAWSHDLLTADEQVLFRRLAVFRGCTLDAVEEVCAVPATQPGSSSIAIRPLEVDVLEGVASLVDKHLLRQEELPDGQPWYVMLETVREFAQECLAESGEADAVQRRHILHYLKLAESAEQEITRPGEEKWHARVEREHDNFRAAMDACLACGYVDPGFRLALALWWYWTAHGHVGEGRQRFAALLARFPSREATGPRAAQRANALRAAGTLAALQGDFAAARALQEAGLAIWRALGDPGGTQVALSVLASVASSQGDDVAARAFAQEALAGAHAIGDKMMIINALYTGAYVLHEQGDYAAARALAEESLGLSQNIGDRSFIAHGSLQLGLVARDQGDYDLAQKLTDDSIGIYREGSTRREIGIALAQLGSIALARGDFARARERLGESLVTQQELGDLAGLAFVLERFAAQTAAQGAHRRAVCLAGAAAALRGAVGFPLSPRSQSKLDDELAVARRGLGETAAAEAWTEGRGMTVEAAVALALAPVEAGSPGPAPDGSGSRRV